MPKHPPPLPDFENALSELERIVGTMETGQLSLDDALTSYQRGMSLLRHCQETLGSAEEKIRIIEQGGPEKAPAARSDVPEGR
jgi:exodeoxyribonuclease VII small subunit